MTSGLVLVCAGLAGFLIEGSFSAGQDVEIASVAGVEINGWWSVLLTSMGLLGLALAARRALVFCMVSTLVFGLVAIGGFFGAHGGEPVPMIASRLPVATGNSVMALLLACLAAAPFALPAHGPGRQTAPIGRPRSARRVRSARRSIN